ncbi:glutaredoxin family protein [Microlunatus elymi]|uniref:Glutaredoxin family protein n=1 Tax=Microlunatus elymi TaxID=2596828 RepID=A0A516Q4B6_9ACTN|nr:glutaredoxin family protein [Microlunatus elymi]QDP98283.1 glutaredoxin family protein [Microlunatus elymi]
MVVNPAQFADAGDARVVLLTRVGCHLCADAVAVVARVCAETGTPYAEVDVDSDPQLQREFTDQVPVTFVDGRQHDFWRVDEDRLRQALSETSRK